MPSHQEHDVADGELRNKDEREVPIGAASDPEARAHTRWRCGDCGAVGRLEDELPAACPECGADRAALYYLEDD